ncbi:unnamed protein product [Amoebophrya sp. A120]|nr:unnamed protein product [Amoebophrya sp. A120]|eukprot:GSA120T00019868001.1
MAVPGTSSGIVVHKNNSSSERTSSQHSSPARGSDSQRAARSSPNRNSSNQNYYASSVSPGRSSPRSTLDPGRGGNVHQTVFISDEQHYTRAASSNSAATPAAQQYGAPSLYRMNEYNMNEQDVAGAVAVRMTPLPLGTSGRSFTTTSVHHEQSNPPRPRSSFVQTDELPRADYDCCYSAADSTGWQYCVYAGIILLALGFVAMWLNQEVFEIGGEEGGEEGEEEEEEDRRRVLLFHTIHFFNNLLSAHLFQEFSGS